MKQLNIHMGKVNFDFYLMLYTKTNLKWVTGINVKLKV